MKRLIYVSSASSTIELSDLESILEVSQKRNAEKGVTGVLLYNGLNFLQVLEGEAAAVDELYKMIARDDQHSGVVTIYLEEIPHQAFDGWSMKVRMGSVDESDTPEGAERVQNFVTGLPATLPEPVRKILASFNTLKS
ncbi:BLUF domain-containing protein [Parvularcula sp. LCG005]|uniref:BLUF domain-containing protein n=1 Tax=Parvularcula sp. LCG005 TaxID=3078805 RepID=UPI0029438648|nr:BLUF domain-containing protein [Parvularcula sp. LCG005]WOI52536.1 BLUF domain-containing protein [Parvularcula sp. LCG005]